MVPRGGHRPNSPHRSELASVMSKTLQQSMGDSSAIFGYVGVDCDAKRGRYRWAVKENCCVNDHCQWSCTTSKCSVPSSASSVKNFLLVWTFGSRILHSAPARSSIRHDLGVMASPIVGDHTYPHRTCPRRILVRRPRTPKNRHRPARQFPLRKPRRERAARAPRRGGPRVFRSGPWACA